MTVKFYDVGQGLGVLVTLPDGRQLLVDAGVLGTWPKCSECRGWSRRFLEQLEGDVTDGRLDLLWITHQHADHNGNAIEVIERYEVGVYADNGTAGQKKRVQDIREAAKRTGATVWAAEPGRTNSPLGSTTEVTITPQVPQRWPRDCEHYPNDCSVGLRIDYCESSVLFIGDAESAEERVLDTGDVDLLQVGHHGSATSSSAEFLARVQPEYAVISSAKPNEGTNKTYCHPRESTIAELAKHIAPARRRDVLAFDGAVRCGAAHASNWRRMAVSQNLYLTARDGDVTLQTTGDGRFTRVSDDGAALGVVSAAGPPAVGSTPSVSTVAAPADSTAVYDTSVTEAHLDPRHRHEQ